MTDISDLARILTTQIEEAVQVALHKAAQLVAEEATNMIGNDQPEWPPLTESTIATKQHLGYPVPAPLLREGDLKRSIKTVIETGRATVFSDDPKAIAQEMGDPTQNRPPRPFLTTALFRKQDEVLAILKTELGVG